MREMVQTKFQDLRQTMVAKYAGNPEIGSVGCR
jgi:hypothetical protein